MECGRSASLSMYLCKALKSPSKLALRPQLSVQLIIISAAVKRSSTIKSVSLKRWFRAFAPLLKKPEFYSNIAGIFLSSGSNTVFKKLLQSHASISVKANITHWSCKARDHVPDGAIKFTAGEMSAKKFVRAALSNNAFLSNVAAGTF